MAPRLAKNHRVFSAGVTAILRTSTRISFCHPLHSNGPVMTSQAHSRVAAEDIPANASTMELAGPAVIRSEQSRQYQREMYEASMERNIIVVMDTGSGKTHIAVMRIEAELERCPPHKRVWFLAPTVALCEQQCSTIRRNIPYAQTRLIVGSDNVDRWSNQRIWDTVLENVRVVVSTHDVLSDALSHGFVRIEGLALLVFDEAHHCAGGHSANKIMKNYYHPLLALSGLNAVPHILGLTASPVIRSKPSDLEIIERNLNALCRTPRANRAELLEYVHPPTFVRLAYFSTPSIYGEYTSSALVSLVAVYRNVMDPITPEAWGDIDQEKILGELKSFCTKACHIYDELGQWAADYYIKTSIEIWSAAESNRKADVFSITGNQHNTLLELFLRQVESATSALQYTHPDETNTTRKVRQLVRFLTSYREGDLHGIIFVQQRATVAVLHQLLSLHPETKSILRCGTFIGTSNFSGRRSSLGDWLNPKGQIDTLSGFRKKDMNFIIATSVLEEGIDISACNIVICFNRPPNLKSFIQRRGRARKSRSIFVLLAPSGDRSLGPEEWGDMENQMRKEYEKDVSERQKLQQLEDAEEYIEGLSNARFEIKSTGALLTLETAVAHIHHFCATLPPQPFVDLQPKFYFQESSYGLITGIVTLPNCVDPSVRKAASSREWKSERMAKKDAAFQAYVALYMKGLVNDNLLPLLLTKDEGIVADIETRASFEEVSEVFNPWINLAKSWMEPGDFLKKKLISITRPSLPTLYLTMALPQELPALEAFTIYWDSQTTYTISINDTAQTPNTDTPFIPIMRQVTSTIFQAVHSNRMPSGRDDFLALFIPHISEGFLQSWLEENAGNFPAAEIPNMKRKATFGLVRDQARYAAPHIFEGTNDDGTIKVTRLPKRRDFLHHGYAIKPDTENEVDGSEKPVLVLPLESSTVDKLSLEYVECSLLIPSIMHRLWRQALALDLYNTVFEGQGFLNLDYIITATNTPSANENSNYQRLEFIGDSVLKYLVCLNLYASHPSWPEGYLSRAKDQTVANSRLSRASLAAGLDRYIVTKSFTARKWSPPYIKEILEAESSPEKRTFSTKVLADVVEALIGGSFLDGGFDAAATCISRFIPEMPITTPLHIFSGAYNAAGSAFVPTSLASRHLSGVERIIGYQFKNRSYLLEAITHPSCEHDANTSSYQRLEFIGDAALDMIVVSFMIDNAQVLSHGKMHLTKTAVVNAGFLAYLCLDASLEQDVTDVCLSPNHGSAAFTEVHSSRLVHLCQLMRHQHPDINTEMISCLERYHELHPAISAAINHGNEYPWVQLASLAPAKFISDIIESIIGAILIDSGGDLGTCTKVAEHLGLIGYLRRILNGNIDILHPKNKLGEMALDRRVDYKLGKDGEEYTCTVEVGGTAIVSVSQGISQEEVMTRAAYMAAELLR